MLRLRSGRPLFSKHGMIIASAVALVLLFTVTGCAPVFRAAQPADDYYAGGEGDYAYAEEAAMAPGMEAPAAEPALDAGALANTTIQLERLIIRTGSVSISVTDTIEAEKAIENMVAGMAQDGAFVVNSSQYGGGPASPYISMQIRVPATRFDQAMDFIAGLAAEGTVPSLSESAQDVTEEYVDVSSRLESLGAARDRLLDLMENAETTEDLLAAEQQLTYREQEIESLKGRQNYLAESARLSSITIDLQPYILGQPVDTRWRPAETFREALDALVDGMRDFADFLIRFVVAVLPFLIIVGLIIYGIVRFIIWLVRRGQARRAARSGGTGTS